MLVCCDRDPRYLYSIDAWVRQRSYTRWALEALDNSLVSASAPIPALGVLAKPAHDCGVTSHQGALLCALR